MRYLGIFFAAVLAASPAQADRKCFPVHELRQTLTQGQFREAPFFVGQIVPGAHVEIYANEKTRTWTIIEVVDGTACILRVGQPFGGNFIIGKGA